MGFRDFIRKYLRRILKSPTKSDYEMSRRAREPSSSQFDDRSQNVQTEINFFEPIEQYCHIVGIKAHQTNQNNRFNARNLTILLVFGIFIVLEVFYIVYEAKSFDEYNITVYVISSLLGISICFANLIWNMPKIFHVFKSIEAIIRNSKFE